MDNLTWKYFSMKQVLNQLAKIKMSLSEKTVSSSSYKKNTIESYKK